MRSFLKLFCGLMLLFSISHSASAQFEIAEMTWDTSSLKSVVRFSLDYGIEDLALTSKDKPVYIASGLLISNRGFIFKDDQHKYKHRALGVTIPLNVATTVNKLTLFVTHQFTYNFNYKYKKFVDKERSNKIKKTYGGERLNNFYPSIGGGFSYGGVGIKILYHYRDFFDHGFALDNGVKPYENWNISNHLMISFFTGFTSIPKSPPKKNRMRS